MSRIYISLRGLWPEGSGRKLVVSDGRNATARITEKGFRFPLVEGKRDAFVNVVDYSNDPLGELLEVYHIFAKGKEIMLGGIHMFRALKDHATLRGALHVRSLQDTRE